VRESISSEFAHHGRAMKPPPVSGEKSQPRRVRTVHTERHVSHDPLSDPFLHPIRDATLHRDAPRRSTTPPRHERPARLHTVRIHPPCAPCPVSATRRTGNHAIPQASCSGAVSTLSLWIVYKSPI
jgi:hypothetical protein